jgi:hypothetical protein
VANQLVPFPKVIETMDCFYNARKFVRRSYSTRFPHLKSVSGFGMIILDPDFFPIPGKDPGSNNDKKREVKIKCHI